MNNALINYIILHDNWRKELSEDPYSLSIKDDGPYTIFSYNQIKSDFKLPEVQVARGIILKISETYAGYSRCASAQPVCWAFNKFFNYGEPNAHSIDWTSARVQEKIDGSITKVWYDAGWHISTNGVIDAFKCDLQMPTDEAKNFGELFMLAWKNSPHGNGDFADAFGGFEKYTFVFELTSPQNRVVIPYRDTKISFIGMRNNETGKEVDPDSLGYWRFNRPKMYDLTFDNIFIASQALPYDEEGYVVVDKNWDRVKIKSPAYLAAHHLKDNGNVNPKRVLELVKANEIDEFLTYFPEYTDIFNKVKSAWVKVNIQIAAALAATDGFKKSGITKKEFASIVMQEKPLLRGFMFAAWDGKDIQAMLDRLDADDILGE